MADLLNYVIFAVLVFYILTIGGLFVLRRTRPEAERPYRAIGYPVLPAIYIVMALFIDVVLLRYKPQYTWPGLIIVLLGIPVYFVWSRRSAGCTRGKGLRWELKQILRRSTSSSLFRTKSIDRLLDEIGRAPLKRTLGPMSLVALGIGAIIGAGLFVRTAAAIAERAGPSVTLAFILAGVGCAFAGLCYAEFASMIPIAGSAYTYSYTTMGEFVAWIIGWDLVLEYAVGAATVAIAWSQYFNRVLAYVGLHIPYQWYHSPFEVGMGADAGVHGIMNIPAVFILLILSRC